MEIIKDAIVKNRITATMTYRALVKLTIEDLEQNVLVINNYNIGIKKDNNKYNPGLYLIRISNEYNIAKINTIKEYLNLDSSNNINKLSYIIYIDKDESKLISDIDSPNENNQYIDHDQKYTLIGEDNNKKLFLNIENLNLLIYTVITDIDVI